MRAQLLAAAALAAFFGGLSLQAAGASFRGIDAVTALLFTAGGAAGVWTYLAEKAPAARRIAVVAAGLNVAGLVLLASASF